jgi:hypothetical protein
VLDGKVPVPAALARQVALIAGHCRQQAMPTNRSPLDWCRRSEPTGPDHSRVAASGDENASGFVYLVGAGPAILSS